MSRIFKLSPLLANQIAAGEVVERPASIVKELLENSLDAQATQLEIRVQDGGLGQILVRDNGSGIHPEDLSLAICRHATSKIRTSADLAAIWSLGFRGEALASIAAVAKVRISSLQRDQEQAWELLVAGDPEHPHLQTTAHPHGTSIEINELFFNLPARRRFLKSIKTEKIHTEEVIHKIVLSKFEVGFSYYANDKLIFKLPPALDELGQQLRIKSLLGSKFIENSAYLELEANGLRLKGWLSLPNYHSSSSTEQHLFINGRSVKDKLFAHAVRQAYEGSLAAGRHPAYILYLDLDPRELDVNVHPSKQEVKFAQPRAVHNFILQSLRQALGTVRDEIPNLLNLEQTPSFNLVGANNLHPNPSRALGAKKLREYTQAAVQAASYIEASSAVRETAISEQFFTPQLGSALLWWQEKFLLSYNAFEKRLWLIDVEAAYSYLAKISGQDEITAAQEFARIKNNLTPAEKRDLLDKLSLQTNKPEYQGRLVIKEIQPQDLIQYLCV